MDATMNTLAEQLEAIYSKTHIFEVTDIEGYIYTHRINIIDRKSTKLRTSIEYTSTIDITKPWKLLVKTLVSLVVRVDRPVPLSIREQICEVVHYIYDNVPIAELKQYVKGRIVSADVFYVHVKSEDKSVNYRSLDTKPMRTLKNKDYHGDGVRFFDLQVPGDYIKIPCDFTVIAYAEEYVDSLLIDDRQRQPLLDYIAKAKSLSGNGRSLYDFLDERGRKFWIGMSDRVRRNPNRDSSFPTGFRFQRVDMDGKGEKGGRCNVNACQSEIDVNYYNKSMRAYYCKRCKDLLSERNPGIFTDGPGS